MLPPISVASTGHVATRHCKESWEGGASAERHPVHLNWVSLTKEEWGSGVLVGNWPFLSQNRAV